METAYQKIPSPDMGEVREGEAAFGRQKAIARFPHPNPPHGGGGEMHGRTNHLLALRFGQKTVGIPLRMRCADVALGQRHGFQHRVRRDAGLEPERHR